MTTALKLRRGTTAQHASFTGAVGEVTVDTTKKTAVVHDGSTAGGTPLAKESALSTKADTTYVDGKFNTTFSFKNRIINGDMRIDQRNAGASVTPASNGLYNLDRWAISVSQGSKFSVQQNAGSVTPPVGFSHYLGLTSTSAYTAGVVENFALTQAVEGFNFADMAWGTANAKTVTLSFWVRSSLTGTFGGGLLNAAQNRSYVFSYTISAANTWEYKTVPIAGDTTGTWVGATNGIGLYLFMTVGAGSNVSKAAGSWGAGYYVAPTGSTSVVGTNGATFYLTGVQLEVGSSATPFDTRPYGTELALCQRYYWRNTGALYAMHGSGTVFSATLADIYVKFPVSMRTAPTISISATQVQVGGSNFTPSAIAGASGITNDVAFARLTSSGMTTGQAAILINNNNSAGYFEASSEL